MKSKEAIGNPTLQYLQYFSPQLKIGTHSGRYITGRVSSNEVLEILLRHRGILHSLFILTTCYFAQVIFIWKKHNGVLYPQSLSEILQAQIWNRSTLKQKNSKNESFILRNAGKKLEISSYHSLKDCINNSPQIDEFFF